MNFYEPSSGCWERAMNKQFKQLKFSHYLLMLKESQVKFRGFLPTKHFWSFTAKRRCSILSWNNSGVVLKPKEKNNLIVVRLLKLVWHNQSHQRILNWFENVIYLFFLSWNLPCCFSATSVSMSPVEDVNNVFSNEFGISWPFYVFFLRCFCTFLNKSPSASAA